MMNTVGELVINRTRMLGRVAELERLRDTLGFSKERLQGKVSEFQEKYEFNRISSTRGQICGWFALMRVAVNRRKTWTSAPALVALILLSAAAVAAIREDYWYG